MKNSIREALLQERELYSPTNEEIENIKKRFFSLPKVKASKYVLLYFPHKKEVNTLPIIDELLKQKKVILLPKVKDKDILPIQVKNLSTLKSGYAGIKEPEGNPVSPEIIDVIVIPGIAFDKRGYRLGYGKGFYDRFLKKTKGLKVGLAYDFQVLDKLPKEEHDVPVDILITPTKTIYIKEEKND
ncbi:MAG: 5-formyltetrahydrofolate cyclo-ligase [Aquificae bacterium]|nr:5-formyltetrahydrofolate cyclo-ligase [Aquificota bacterium]